MLRKNLFILESYHSNSHKHLIFFFISSRRRHTRFDCDWSSDVCSSDLVVGGHIQNFVGLPRASIYDPVADRWTALPDMNAGRWNPTATTLPNGDVLIISGDIDTSVAVNPPPQVFQTASGSWRDLSNAQLLLDLYPYMHVAPNGLVFHSRRAASPR